MMSGIIEELDGNVKRDNENKVKFTTEWCETTSLIYKIKKHGIGELLINSSGCPSTALVAA